jgi:hypothetical protein
MPITTAAVVFIGGEVITTTTITRAGICNNKFGGIRL